MKVFAEAVRSSQSEMMIPVPDFLMIVVGWEMSLKQLKMPDSGWTYLVRHFRLRAEGRGLQKSQWALACGPGMGDVRLCVI
jgi:hypothetical protein